MCRRKMYMYINMRYKTKKYIRSGNSLEFQKGFTVVMYLL